MGKTYRSNDRWKKVNRDRNFRKSNKFKHLKDGFKEKHKPLTDKAETNDLVENT